MDLLGEYTGQLNDMALPMVKAAVSAKIQFGMLYLITGMVVLISLQISYQATKCCFSHYFSFTG